MKVLTGRQRRGNILSLGGTLPTTLDLNHPDTAGHHVTHHSQGRRMCNCVSILSYLLNYPWINSCPNFCICHLKTKNPGVAWLRDLKKKSFGVSISFWKFQSCCGHSHLLKTFQPNILFKLMNILILLFFVDKFEDLTKFSIQYTFI